MDHLSLVEVEEAGMSHLIGKWVVGEEEAEVGMWVRPRWVGEGGQSPCERREVHLVPEEVEEEQGHLQLQKEGEVGGELWVRLRRVAVGTRSLWPEEEVVARWCGWGWRRFARWEQKVEVQRCRGWICMRDRAKTSFSCSTLSASGCWGRRSGLEPSPSTPERPSSTQQPAGQPQVLEYRFSSESTD